MAPPVADLTASQEQKITRVQRHLIHRGISFHGWCRKRGFNESTARLAVSGVHDGVVSTRIMLRLKRDFPKLEI